LKIADVDVAVIESGPHSVMGESLILKPACVIVRLTTDDGLVGIGGATANLGGRGIGLATLELTQIVIGADAIYRESIWQKLLAANIVVFPPQALAAIDCALWDLFGKRTGMPVYQLLGAYRDRVPTYASTLTYGSIDEFIQVVDDCRARGLRFIKLHGWGDPDRDIALCQAVRKHVGAGFGLMFDAVGSYDPQQALRMGRALEDLQFEWFEMPIRDQSIIGYQQLARSLDIAVASGEVHTYSFQETANYLTARAWDIARIDAAISGGITGARKAAALAEGFGVRCELHAFGHALAQAANLQVIGAIANCSYFEAPLPLDAYNTGMVDVVEIDDNGIARIPSKPGLGLEADWDAILAQSIAVT
jgi:L-alanine-DL-glutamate epimerase-like enolase superfamily enzyme